MIKYLLIGYICMCLLALQRNRKYKLPKVKLLLVVLFLVICGVIGTLVLFYVENGRWGGTSFFGSVLLIPVLFLGVSKIVKVPYGKLMDLSSPLICMMLLVMKVNCYFSGCCGGRKLLETTEGTSLCFPSQIAEALVVLFIMLVLLWTERQKGYEHKLYPLLLILYGSTRFILNTFRAELSPFIWILPPGHFWSIVAVILGGMALWFIQKKSYVQS